MSQASAGSLAQHKQEDLDCTQFDNFERAEQLKQLLLSRVHCAVETVEWPRPALLRYLDSSVTWPLWLLPHEKSGAVYRIYMAPAAASNLAALSWHSQRS